jgi:hypothetical protein
LTRIVFDEFVQPVASIFRLGDEKHISLAKAARNPRMALESSMISIRIAFGGLQTFERVEGWTEQGAGLVKGL